MLFCIDLDLMILDVEEDGFVFVLNFDVKVIDYLIVVF